MEVPQPRDPGVDPRDAVIESSSYLTRAEEGELIVECMAEQGFVGVLDPISGGVEINLADPTQEDAMQDAFLICVDRVAEIVGPPPEETPEYLTKVYRAWLWTHQCLVEEGYAPSDPPTLDVFLEGADDRWHPYEFRDRGREMTEAEFYQIEDACPANPFFLFEYLSMD